MPCKLFPIIVVALLLAPNTSRAEVILEHRGAHLKSSAITESFPLAISDTAGEYGISVTAVLDSGSGSLRVLDPGGEMIYQHLWSTRRSQERARLPITTPGTYTIEVALENARGEWRARVVPLPSRGSLRWMYLSAGLLIALPILLLAIAHYHGATVRFAAAGALMFLAGRVIWFAGAIVLDISARFALEDALPYKLFLWTQSILLGVWEGLAATLSVLAIAMFVKPLRVRPANAIAAGAGTGAFEMIVTGLLSILGLAIMFGGGAKSDKAQFLQAYDMAVTPALPIADPTILVVRTACTVAATTLILYGLRARRLGPLCGGFAIFGSVLTAVSASRMLSLFGPESRWIIMAVLLPVAGGACIVLRRNLSAWVESPKNGETAMDAFLREHETGEN